MISIVVIFTILLDRKSEFFDAALGKCHLLWGFSWLGANSFNWFDNFLAGWYSSEDDMSSVKPVGISSGDEELTSIGSGSSIGHRNAERFVFELEVFIGESISVDRLASSSVSSSEITALDHEVGDNSVEGTSCVFAGRIVSFAQSNEVFNSFRYDFSEKIKHDIAPLFSTDFDTHGHTVSCYLLR